MTLCLIERDGADPIAYSKMTDGVGAPVDGLMARGGPGLALPSPQALPSTASYCGPGCTTIHN